MQRIDVQSSLLSAIGYDKDSRVLVIEFRSKKEGEPGKSYRYEDVSPEAFERFRSAPSLGSHFLKQIKNQHACTRIEEPNAEDQKKADEARKPFNTAEPEDGAPF